MTRYIAVLLAATTAASAAHAQRRPEEGRREAARPLPPPPPRSQPGGGGLPLVERRPDGRVDNTPHVVNGTWYGHAVPNDPRFRVATPYPNGRFAYVGPTHRWRFARVVPLQREVFLPNGQRFVVSPADWAFASGWCWTCANNFVVYDDPDHPGWYLLYNVATGQYAHVQYLGT